MLDRHLKLDRDERDHAVRHLQTYLERERDEPMGDLAAGLLLDFIAEQIGPLFYNRGLRTAGALLTRSVDSLNADLDAAHLLPPRLSRDHASPGDDTSRNSQD